MTNAFGVEHTPIAKAEKKSKGNASLGRQATAQVFGGWHGAVAGRKGHKLRAIGNEVGGSIAGSTAGSLAGAGAGAVLGRKLGGAEGAKIGMAYGSGAGSVVGGRGGLAAGVQRANKKGHFKPEKVSKAGDWKTIDQRERSQRQNRKHAGTAASLGGLAATGGAYAAAASPKVQNDLGRMKTNAKSGFKFRRSFNAQMGAGTMKGNKATDAAFGVRNALSTTHAGHGKAAAGAVVGGIGVGVGGAAAAKGVNAYHQKKINERRRANHAKVTKAFTEPVGKGFPGAAIKGIKSVIGATRGAGNAISTAGSKAVGSQMVKPGAHAALPKLGTLGKTKVAGGLALQKTGSAIAAHPKTALGVAGGTATAGTAGMAAMGGHKR
jgi:hypothetical protein